MKKVVVGIIGCGNISHVYLRDLKRLYSGELEVRALAGAHLEHAQKMAEQYEIPKACTVEELLADPEIELVVDLTPPAYHVEINKKILNAGKHCYTEKPFALTLEEAEEVCSLARQRGLIIASAPDSFLGSSISTCRKLLRDNWIGRPHSVTMNMVSHGVETWHPAPESYYKKGGGPVYDMGGYYFSVLVSLLGPVESVFAYRGQGINYRKVYTKERFGSRIEIEEPTHYVIVMRTVSGVMVNATFSFDVWKSSLPNFEIYGTDGTLFVPDPNMHGGVPKVFRKEQALAKCFGGNDTGDGEPFAMPELTQDIGEYVRCLGVVDACRAVRDNREPACSGELAVHVVDIMTSIMKSAETGEQVKLKTTYTNIVETTPDLNPRQ